MDNEHIQRSRLFREAFLPGAVTRLRYQANAQVVGVRNNDVALDTIDKAQLLITVKKYLADWEASGGKVDEALRNAIDHNKATVQSPSEVYISPYPLLLRCERCKVIDFYDPRVSQEKVGEAIKRRIVRSSLGQTYIKCKRSACAGRMLQVPYVGVHRCGIMNPIFVNQVARRKPNVGYEDASGSFFNSFFFDVDTKERLGGSLQDDCPACRLAYPGLQETNKRGTPVTSGESFYSQIVQYIALSAKAGNLAAMLYAQINATIGTLKGQTCDIAEGITSVLLGTLDSAALEQQLRALLDEAAPSDDLMKTHAEELAKSIAARDRLAPMIEDELFQHMYNSMVKKISELESLLANASGRFKGVRQYLDNDATYVAIVSQRRSLEAAFLRHDVRRLTVGDAIAATEDAVARAAKADHWQVVKTRYGVAEIAHIPDLLVVLSALGYTRERRAPTLDVSVPPVVLNGFEDANDAGMRGRTSLYAMSANTEAVWIRLDPLRVLQWCVDEVGWADPGVEIMASRQLAQAYLLQHSPALTMAPGDVIKEITVEKVSQSAPFHLLHSICHSLLATSRRHTGYDDQSLMEYLLPMDLSFVIYVTSVQNFTAGGLLTMFQHYLLPWFNDASTYAFSCAFDPICSDTGGSCSGCIQRERACETFNAGLSRAYLHGGNADRDYRLNIKKGFWDQNG